MTDKDIKEYLKELIKKYDYYDPVKDRTEALRLGKVKNKSILDIDTGKGSLAILAAKNFNCNVTTIDKSKEKISIAKENAQKEGLSNRIRFRLCNAVNLPFGKGSFDSVISFNALHHDKENYEKIIKEMFRVAKEKIVITEVNEFGTKVFDEYIHPEENHKNMVIDLGELEDKLKKHSTVKKFDRKLMSTFVCIKNKGGREK